MEAPTTEEDVLEEVGNSIPVENEHDGILTLLRNALQNPDQLTAMISNYSTSYNAVNVGIVLPILMYSIESSSKDEPYSTPQDYVALSIARRLDSNNNSEDGNDEEEDSIVASSLLAGMILGQLIGGYLGDIIGRRPAMMLVMILQIVGSIGSALFISTGKSTDSVYQQLAIWRFILGVGAGGVYPLAAVMSAENKQDDLEEEDTIEEDNTSQTNDIVNNSTDQVKSFQRIALTFSTQGLGFITVPLLAYPMLAVRMNIDVIWRLLLGLGALPGIVVLYMRLCSGKRCSKEKDRIQNALHESDNNGMATEEANTEEVSSDSSASLNKAGSLELPKTSDSILDDGNLQSTISTLFNDLANTGTDEDNIGDGDNELSLVENCHRANDGNNERCAENEEAAVCDEVPSLTEGKHSRGLLESIQAEPDLLSKLAGTAGTWFLFDLLFYGNTLFEPLVLEAAFGSNSSNTEGYELLQTTVRDSLVISLLSLPGYFVTVALIGRRTCACRSLRSSSSTTRCGSVFPCVQTPAHIQMQGFFLMFILYIIIGVCWQSLISMQFLLIFLYAGTFFFSNYGPNSTTFLLPSVTYELEDSRSTLNGISAAAGKCGAFLGAALFAPLADTYGESIVMISCGVISLLAFASTKLFIRRGGS